MFTVEQNLSPLTSVRKALLPCPPLIPAHQLWPLRPSRSDRWMARPRISREVPVPTERPSGLSGPRRWAGGSQPQRWNGFFGLWFLGWLVTSFISRNERWYGSGDRHNEKSLLPRTGLARRVLTCTVGAPPAASASTVGPSQLRIRPAPAESSIFVSGWEAAVGNTKILFSPGWLNSGVWNPTAGSEGQLYWLKIRVRVDLCSWNLGCSRVNCR